MVLGNMDRVEPGLVGFRIKTQPLVKKLRNRLPRAAHVIEQTHLHP